jgi:hypothetical protein
VTRTPIVVENFRPKSEPKNNMEESALQCASEQAKTNVYDAYWQARSGFSYTPPKPPVASIASAESSYP